MSLWVCVVQCFRRGVFERGDAFINSVLFTGLKSVLYFQRTLVLCCAIDQSAAHWTFVHFLRRPCGYQKQPALHWTCLGTGMDWILGCPEGGKHKEHCVIIKLLFNFKPPGGYAENADHTRRGRCPPGDQGDGVDCMKPSGGSVRGLWSPVHWLLW